MNDNTRDTTRRVVLLAGPLVVLLMISFLDLAPGKPQVTRTATVAVLMALWWIFEVVPLAVTALLPVELFPVLGVMNGKEVAAQYFNHIIFLFIGGFIVALAMEKCGLHRRIALRILLLFGNRPRQILLGFMAATAFLSMWISNTATSMMMVTIVLATIVKMEETAGPAQVQSFSKGLLLGIAYSASIGGISTLVGTPPNMSFVRIFEIQFPAAPQISFASWFIFAFPISLVCLVITWLLLSWMYIQRDARLPINRGMILEQYRELGRPSFAERLVFIDFMVMVALWLFMADITMGGITVPGWSRLLPYPGYVNDGAVAIAMAVMLFIVPAGRGTGVREMDWQTANKVPWSIVLLFGGGFALAKAFVKGGLSAWIGQELKGAASLDSILLVAIICLCITFLTELTSNTATTEMMLPIMAALAVSVKLHPLFIMIPVTISCSCAFMMPVATPPNAIVFGTERLEIKDMARAGILLNLVGAVVIVVAITYLGGPVWGISVHNAPAWAVTPGTSP